MQAVKSSEVAVERTDACSVFDSERREVGVRDEVSVEIALGE